MRIFVVILLFFVIFHILMSNPIGPLFISEIYFEGDEWTIEFRDEWFDICSLDGYQLITENGSSYFNNGITFDYGEILLINQEDLQDSLFINKTGDMIEITGLYMSDKVYFGNHSNSFVNPVYDGQSLVQTRFEHLFSYPVLVKENNPTLGSNTFQTSSSGFFCGRVYDLNNNPIPNATISFELYNMLIGYEIQCDHSGYFEEDSLYAMNYGIYVLIDEEIYSYANISVEPDSITYLDFVLDYIFEEEDIPNTNISLMNFPNPFYPSQTGNANTTISFSTTENTESTEKAITIYNQKGQKVKQLSINDFRLFGMVEMRAEN